MGKPFVTAFAASALVLLVAAAYFADGKEFGEISRTDHTEPHVAKVVAISAPQPAGLALSWPEGQPSGGLPYELYELLQQSKLGEAWLTAHGFSSGSALQRLHSLLDAGTSIVGEPRLRVGARPSGASASDDVGLSRLAAEERYVMAIVEKLPASGDDSVLVRWRNISDNTILELSAQAMPVNGEPLQLWMHFPQGWAPGSYRLEVISANAALEPLAVANFEIASSDLAITAFSYPVQAAAQR